MERWQSAGFGLYVHWPFCQSKCPYCDFNSHVSAKVDHDVWRVAFLAEMRRYAELSPDRVLSSIFFGGGTPSLMDPATVEAIIDDAAQLWKIANNVEITLEANPTSVEIDKFQAFKTAGVNRVSVGVQALNDNDLRRLGRLHDAHEARRAIEVSQQVFDRTSFDLIYARQDQTIGQWRSELVEALKLAGGHLSLYQLTIEPGTVFGARYDRGLLRGLPVEDVAAEMYELTQEICSDAGYNAYEVSNHARSGEESRHNLIYWRGGDYVGVGPGAHGRITKGNGERFATTRPLAPTTWLQDVKTNAKLGLEPISREDQAAEFIMMGLRLSEGIDLTDYRAIAGNDLPQQPISELDDLGLVTVADGRLRATASGRLVLNAVLRKLVAG
ncbi:radical SAM family heme chaperone HemW [Pseudotabrizicola algicola]|uniref:Heme chaperone HemW n=1 Tax=Pseudotabrizicola algicola TaxID=2709381 RepID=A0A6B3RRJ1_9RHOB|nr:radical SAM family heme chaperone HemW [Pseudotabrizicola algicola]NEX48091.1 coproporphyrinogen III oxidase [Pseudotabrizicola algicola]